MGCFHLYDFEDYETFNKGFTLHTYDNGGNITKKVEKNLSGTVLNTYNYYYDNVWKDQLVRVNVNGVDKYITYDSIGNPTTYQGRSMSWQNGRELKSVSTGAEWGTVTMEYDYQGLRTKKTRTGGTRGTATQYYYWEGDKLLAEQHGAQFIWYYYDETGISGMNFQGNDYYFRKNMFGDVIAIYDSNGTWQGRYDYDAWGKFTISGNSVMEWNPFRYRGYYYDQDTGYYYLQSRHYDPQTGRFLNADEPSMLFETAGVASGANLYAYCLNNPVMFTDPSGKIVISIIISVLVAGAVVGAGVGGYVAVQNGAELWSGEFWQGVATGAFFGVAAGGAVLILGSVAAVYGAKLFGVTLTKASLASIRFAFAWGSLAFGTGIALALMTQGIPFEYESRFKDLNDPMSRQGSRDPLEIFHFYSPGVPKRTTGIQLLYGGSL